MGTGIRIVGALLLSLLAAPALAQTTTHSVYLDLDANPATGCSVVTDAGAVTGVEARVSATVAGSPAQVQAVSRASCEGGAFSVASSQPAGYPVGLDLGAGGADVVEFSTALAGLGQGGIVGAVFVSSSATGADRVQASIALTGGEPVEAVPVPGAGWLALALLAGFIVWRARRHPGLGSTLALVVMMGAGVAWAANFIADGQIQDWAGTAPVATDPPNDASDGSADVDLLAVFAATENARLHLRIDVRDLETVANQAPALPDATFELDENSAAGTAVGSLAGTDPDAGQTLAYAITAGNGADTFAIDAASGALSVADAAALDFEATPSFTLTVTATDDGSPALSASGTVTVTLGDVNEAPEIDDQAFTVAEHAANGTAAGTVAATDPDAGAPNATLGYAITAGNTGNAFAIDAASGAITVADSAQVTLANAPFALTVQVSDGGTPALQDSATVTIAIDDVNDAPVFEPDTYAFTLDENSAAAGAVGTVTATDADAGQVLSYALTGGNTGNAFAIDAASGAITVADPAALDFETAPLFTVTVTVSDNGTPPLSDTATVTVDLRDINEAPTASDAAFTVPENSAAATAIGTVTASDPDGTAPNDTLAYAITAGNAGGTFALDAATGALTVADPALLDFESAAVFTLGVTVTDGGGLSDTAQITVTPSDVNEAPALADTTRTVLENSAAGTAVGAPLAATDPDGSAPNNTLSYAITGGNSGTTFAVEGTSGQLTVANPTLLTGGTSFALVVTVTDGGALSATGTVTVHVTDVNDAPGFTAGPDQAGLEDAPAVSLPWATDIDDHDGGVQALTFLVSTDNAALFAAGPAIAADGVLTYRTAPDANGSALVTVTLMDDGGTGNGGADTSAPQTFTITIAPVNDAPGFTRGPDQTVLEDAAPQTVKGWASAISPGPADESGQGVSFSVGTSNPGLFTTAPAIGPNGTLSYAVAADAEGVATVTVTAHDSGGTANDGIDASAPQTFTITVTGVDDAPVAVADAATLAEDAGASPIDVLSNDTDLDAGPIAITAVTQPANGTVVITGGGTGLTYAPDADYCNAPPGTTPDIFTYTLTPGGSTATVSVSVTCLDDAPVAVADAATVAEDSGASAIDVLANDSDVDGGPRLVGAVTQPANGAVVVTGGGTGLTYAPNADYCNAPPGTSPDTFTYTLTPGGSTATVSVSVTCLDDAPVAVADAATVVEDSGANAIAVLANDTDIDGGPRLVGAVTQPANGAVVVNDGGTGLTYAPGADYCNAPPGDASDTFTYTLTPGGSTATVSVAVTCVDDLPAAVDDSATVTSDSGPGAIDVLANDDDIDGGPMLITSVSDPEHGSVAITGGGTGLTYQPDAGYSNDPPSDPADTFTYTLNGGSTATVSVTVEEAGDIDVGAYHLNGSCGVLGVIGPGFTLTASPSAPLPIGTTVTIIGSGVANIGVFSVTGGTANVAVLSGTSRLITLTAPLPAGATMAFRTTLSISVAFTLNATTLLPAGYIGTGAKPNGSVASTLILCSAT